MAIYRQRRDEIENNLNKGALWAVTYGDLMSYLMIFFLVLFSFSITRSDRTKSRKYEESLANIQRAFGGKKTTVQLERAKAKEQEEATEAKIKKSVESNLIQIESGEKKLKLVLTEGVLFDSGKTDLRERAKQVLKPIVDELIKLPNDVVVEGHTDNVPIKNGKYKSNWELSMARTYSVITYLEALGMDKKRLAGIGYGENRPVADNSAAEGRAKNRRIEISLMKTD
ncbi:MAG: OmpA family protein [Elusimicrobiales bacterium]|nr:OmpA family protein [Elusimicrobiales bacterium]